MANKIWTGAVSGSLATAGNYSPSGVPASGDNLRVPVGSPDITAGLTALNNSTLSGALGAVIFEDGCSLSVGSIAAPMQFSCTRFECSFIGGQQFFDLEASNISIRVKSASATPGVYATYIKGSNLATVDIEGGAVAIAGLSFETATVATVRSIGSSGQVFIGEGVTATTIEVLAGSFDLRCAATTVTVDGTGNLTTNGTGAIATLNVNGGTAYPCSSGTLTTVNANGGAVDFTKDSIPRTVTSRTIGRNVTYVFDSAVITHTNKATYSFPVRAIYSPV